MNTPNLPLLPLLLWETPPGLDLILAQEGIALRHVSANDPASLLAGRFLIYDSRKTSLKAIADGLTPRHEVVDVHEYRNSEPLDPFEALIDRKAAIVSWQIGGLKVKETVARRAKGIIRERLIESLRASVLARGGVWARLSPYPHPYQSAFNFRADLDEENPEDYARFAEARRPLEDCTTHFVSTAAYGKQPSVLADLKRFDTQSHGHFHHIYDDPEENRLNLERADAILAESGFALRGFAAPHGKWSPALDCCLESLGYEYSSDFQIGYDDFPFFPWLGNRFSKVLQIPIHPVCEGIFLDAGARGSAEVLDHLVEVARSRAEGHLPAFVYGHPERRLARFPEVLQRLAAGLQQAPKVWRVTLTEFAAWWKFRAEQTWSLHERVDGTLELIRDQDSELHRLGLEIRRGDGVATLPISGTRVLIAPDRLNFRRKRLRFDSAQPRLINPPMGLKSTIRRSIDWETVTPLDQLEGRTTAQRLKRGVRALKSSLNGGKRS